MPLLFNFTASTLKIGSYIEPQQDAVRFLVSTPTFHNSATQTSSLSVLKPDQTNIAPPCHSSMCLNA